MDDTLYVADRKNHLIRALDLKAKTVKTIAGTGEQGQAPTARGGPASRSASTARGTCYLDGNTLHRHGRPSSDLDAGPATVALVALRRQRPRGHRGRPARSVRSSPSRAAWPATANDSTSPTARSSAIRALSAERQRRQRRRRSSARGCSSSATWTASATEARLQHALGVAYHDGKLYVADTYNSKIKVIDPATQVVHDVPGRRQSWMTGCSTSRPGSASPATAVRGRHERPPHPRDGHEN